MKKNICSRRAISRQQKPFAATVWRIIVTRTTPIKHSKWEHEVSVLLLTQRLQRVDFSGAARRRVTGE